MLSFNRIALTGGRAPEALAQAGSEKNEPDGFMLSWESGIWAVGMTIGLHAGTIMGILSIVPIAHECESLTSMAGTGARKPRGGLAEGGPHGGTTCRNSTKKGILLQIISQSGKLSLALGPMCPGRSEFPAKLICFPGRRAL